MKKGKKGAAKAAPSPSEFRGPSTSDVVGANYCIAKPFGGGMLGATPRYQINQEEHAAIRIMSEACDEIPALRAIAEWAEANGAPEALLEALEAARHGERWAVEGRPMPEGHKPYRPVITCTCDVHPADKRTRSGTLHKPSCPMTDGQ